MTGAVIRSTAWIAERSPAEHADRRAPQHRLVVHPHLEQRTAGTAQGPYPADDVGRPTDLGLELAVGIADHRRVETKTGHHDEPPTIGLQQV